MELSEPTLTRVGKNITKTLPKKKRYSVLPHQLGKHIRKKCSLVFPALVRYNWPIKMYICKGYDVMI